MAPDPPERTDIVHASTVAVDGRGLIITGASGQGKSALALHLIGLGAALVSDDRTDISAGARGLIARPPRTIRGMIEARGVGLLDLPFQNDVSVYLAVDLDVREHERLPHPHHMTLLGVQIPCLYHGHGTHFAASVFLYLKYMKPPSHV